MYESGRHLTRQQVVSTGPCEHHDRVVDGKRRPRVNDCKKVVFLHVKEFTIH